MGSSLRLPVTLEVEKWQELQWEQSTSLIMLLLVSKEC